MDIENTQEFYEGKIFVPLKQLETTRIATLRNVLIALVGIIVLSILSMFILPLFKLEWYLSFFLFGILFVLWIPYTKSLSKNFENEVKSKVVHSILKIYGNFIWKQGEGITASQIRASGIFRNFDSVVIDDCFEGTYKDVNIQINEMELWEMRDLEGRASRIKTFNGIYTLFGTNDRISNDTFLIRRRSISFDEPPVEGNKITIGNTNFDNKFEIYCNDEINAKKLITTSLIRLLERFSNYFGQVIFVCAENGCILALGTGKDSFKLGNIWIPATDSKQIKAFVREIYSILSVVDIFGIGNKENNPNI